MKINKEMWLTTKQLGWLENRHRVVIATHIRSGKYTKVRKVKGHGGIKSMTWLVNILDPAISDKTRDRFYLARSICRVVEAVLRVKFEKFEEKIIKEICKCMNG
jgi:hypothetical protein